MSRSSTTRLAALGAAATLVLIPVAATSADPVISQASGNAIHLEIGANEVYDSGTVRATNDGSGEVKTGEVNPPIGLLANQDLLNIGALAQDAAADVNGRNGVSKACAGVAGEGAQVVEVGDSSCITPGQPVDIFFGNLDLTGSIVFTPGSALEGLNGLTDPIIAELVGPLTAAIEEGLAPFGETGLGGTLGAVEARCTADPDSAQGSSNIVDTKLTLAVGGETIDLVNFPANPPPNTKLLTNLDVVLNTIIDALRVDLNTTLDAQLAPLQAIIDPI